MTTFESIFDIGGRAVLDGQQDMIVNVQAVTFRGNRPAEVECSWLHNGENKTAWIESWRLVPAAG